MKLVVFGLTVSSSWGNGHATLWRGLIKALNRRGWSVEFFERDVPYYAGARDLHSLPKGELVLYPDWDAVRPRAQRALRDADVALVTSYCPDGIAATDLVADSGRPLKVFYDLDTPVTLDQISRGAPTSYIGPRGLSDFDLVLSYTGGAALEALRTQLGARMAAPLYGHVDPAVHFPARPVAEFAGDLSYIGTYAEDRQHALDAFLIAPARQCPARRFVIAGAMYPKTFPWTDNIFFVRHLDPPTHAGFYASSRLTLNITRQAMARSGWCPSGRLFEAAACGAAVMSDWWPGLDDFFTAGRELVVVRTTQDALDALELSGAEAARIGRAARERVLEAHTSDHRAAELEDLFAAARRQRPPARAVANAGA